MCFSAPHAQNRALGSHRLPTILASRCAGAPWPCLDLGRGGGAEPSSEARGGRGQAPSASGVSDVRTAVQVSGGGTGANSPIVVGARVLLQAPGPDFTPHLSPGGYHSSPDE